MKMLGFRHLQFVRVRPFDKTHRRVLILGTLALWACFPAPSHGEPYFDHTYGDDLADCEVIIYTVCRGDTIYSIARNANVSVDELIRYNNLRLPCRIYPGQKLEVPYCRPIERWTYTCTKNTCRSQRPHRRPPSNRLAPGTRGLKWPMSRRWSYERVATGAVYIHAPPGETIRAAAGGWVDNVGRAAGGTRYITLLHRKKDQTTTYEGYLIPCVRPGDYVYRGQVIARLRRPFKPVYYEASWMR